MHRKSLHSFINKNRIILIYSFCKEITAKKIIEHYFSPTCLRSSGPGNLKEEISLSPGTPKFKFNYLLTYLLI
jgi:hypothetical protein